MAALSHLPTRTFLLFALALLALQAAVLSVMGQPLLAAAAPFKLWAGNPLGPDNSQQLTDWYSFSHIIHGFIFYGVLKLIAPRLPLTTRLLLAMGVEIGWEFAENSPWVIEAYRKQALAAGYRGDSVINSLSDTVMMATGFLIARRLPWWLTLLLAVAMETMTILVIRDGLVLNVLNFLVSWPALEQWQTAWRPGHSLTLMAFVPRNGPPDRFVRLRRTAPHP
jgi:hypothetical protein